MTASADETRPLAGRVAVVTGAARGQGREIVAKLVSAGARVLAGDVLQEIYAVARQWPEQVEAMHLDVTDESSWKRCINSTLERWGRLDILVNNAGLLRRNSLEDESAVEFERIWRVNCLGPFLGIRAALPYLRHSPGAAVVNTLSTAALTGFTEHGAYASSKWALRGLTRVAALELAVDGIRVNGIAPGPVLTPMVLRGEDPGAADRLAHTPLGRAGVPNDIAELVLFLVSDAASFITGGEFVIDGGQTAGVVMPARR